MISKLPKWLADLTEKSDSFMPSMKILETTYISSNIKKIRFQGDLSRMNFEIGFANVIRVNDTEFRNYTSAYHNKDEGIIEIIFYINGNGAGSKLISNLTTGDELRISIPRGKNFYNPRLKQQFIFGDETSLGMACSIQPLLKENDHQYQFYFELDKENSNIPNLLGLDNSTVFIKNNAFRNEEWLENLPIFNNIHWNEASFILTGNVKSVQTFRKVLKNRTNGKIYSQGYWLEGKKGL